MTLSHPKARRRAVLVLALLAAAAALIAVRSQPSSADGSFAPRCKGVASLGESRSDGQVTYRFFCSDDVFGYSVIVQNREVDAFDTEPVVLKANGEPAEGESFGCSGELPGFGVGCGGTAGAGHRVTGHLNLSSDPCKGGRPILALVVTDEDGRAAGPYRLASGKGSAKRPLNGCPAKAAKKRKKPRAG